MNIEWKILMNNFKIPKIRFNSFEVFWVEDRIADIVKISAGGDVDKEKLKESGKYPVIANALTNKGIVGFYDDYKVKAPAVTVTGRGDVGYAVARHENFTPIVRLLTLQSENIDVDYLENQINSMRILNESTGVPQLTAPQLGNYKVYHPEIEEQSAIGSLFRTLDDLLASYKDNLANYQSLKSTMLSKMFPKAGQTVPEIRLDRFEGEWIEKRLKDISKRVTRKNKDLVSERALTISAQFGLIDQEEFFQKKIASKDVSGYYLIKKGEFAYNKSYSTGYPLGAIKRLDKYENGVLSTLYILFKAVDVDSDYLAHYYESDKWHREVSMCAAEGARNHGLLNIAPADFFNTRLVVPKELAEQQAIGAYFSTLDNLINSHQEKISQLETLKKKLLQDMFI